MKIAIVTGASSGLGEEMVNQIASRYRKLDEIWVIARREDKLVNLKATETTPLRILPYDITKEENVQKLKVLLEKEKPNIRLLANIAGYGKVGKFDEIAYDDTLGMIDVNCKALTAITYVCLPYLKKESKVMQFASVAAFLAQPNMAVYAATKSYVLSLARALNVELKSRKITVTAVCPGPVETEFFQIACRTKEEVQYFKKLFMANKTKVVRKALVDTHCGVEVSVYGLPMNILRGASKIIPQKALIKGQEILARVK
jgi:Short-chain dehydrogenases of various substrate specificities